MLMQKTIKMVSKADRSDAYVYSDANRETVTSIGKLLDRSEFTLAKAITALDESGMAWTFTISPASKSGDSTSTPEQFNMFKSDVLSGFPKKEQELVLAPIQSLDDAQKKARRTVIQKVGRYVNRITSELKKLQVPQAKQDSKTGAKQSTKQSPLVTHREAINGLLNDIENNPDDYPVNRTQYVALLNQCQTVLSKIKQ